jgi:hypothetical protein
MPAQERWPMAPPVLGKPRRYECPAQQEAQAWRWSRAGMRTLKIAEKTAALIMPAP